MTAAGQSLPNKFNQSLPPIDSRIRRKAMLTEQESAARLEHATGFSHVSLCPIRAAVVSPDRVKIVVGTHSLAGRVADEEDSPHVPRSSKARQGKRRAEGMVIY